MKATPPPPDSGRSSGSESPGEVQEPSVPAGGASLTAPPTATGDLSLARAASIGQQGQALFQRSISAEAADDFFADDGRWASDDEEILGKPDPQPGAGKESLADHEAGDEGKAIEEAAKRSAAAMAGGASRSTRPQKTVPVDESGPLGDLGAVERPATPPQTLYFYHRTYHLRDIIRTGCLLPACKTGNKDETPDECVQTARHYTFFNVFTKDDLAALTMRGGAGLAFEAAPFVGKTLYTYPGHSGGELWRKGIKEHVFADQAEMEQVLRKLRFDSLATAAKTRFGGVLTACVFQEVFTAYEAPLAALRYVLLNPNPATEPDCCHVLQGLLKRHCPRVQVMLHVPSGAQEEKGARAPRTASFVSAEQEEEEEEGEDDDDEEEDDDDNDDDEEEVIGKVQDASHYGAQHGAGGVWCSARLSAQIDAVSAELMRLRSSGGGGGGGGGISVGGGMNGGVNSVGSGVISGGGGGGGVMSGEEEAGLDLRIAAGGDHGAWVGLDVNAPPFVRPVSVAAKDGDSTSSSEGT